MKKASFLLIFVLLLFACASVMYNKKLDQYIGQTEQSLIEQWGTPSGQKILADGTKILTYTKINEYYVPTEYFYDQPGWGMSDIVYDPFFDDYSLSPASVIIDTQVESICQTSFIIKNDVVTAYRYRGNGCS